ncbi:MAG: thioredoxin family protein, partial [Pseudomonadota bacterium]
LAMAFLGGILLNLMPCVFPVLTLKIFSLVRHGATGDSQHLRRQGLFYALGVIGAMVLMGSAVLALRAGGAAIGWGFQLQSPAVVGGLTVLFFTLGMAMLGLIKLPYLLANTGHHFSTRQDALGSFGTGVLAVLAASPCTAPFMATAIGAALLLPLPAALGIFAGLGLGMALPLVVLCFVPVLAKRLPNPGRWMEILQQFMAFPLFATSLWLIFVLSQQLGAMGVVIILGGLLAIGFVIWLATLSLVPRAIPLIVGLGFTILSLVALAQVPTMAPSASAGKGAIEWEAYSPARLQTALAAGQPVFVDATAAWCITCLVNEQVVFSDAEVIDMFTAQDILYLQADWTNRDPVVTKLLEEFGRIGLPLYVVYRPDRQEAEVLPQILSPQIVLNAYAGLDPVQQAAMPTSAQP